MKTFELNFLTYSVSNSSIKQCLPATRGSRTIRGEVPLLFHFSHSPGTFGYTWGFTLSKEFAYLSFKYSIYHIIFYIILITIVYKQLLPNSKTSATRSRLRSNVRFLHLKTNPIIIMKYNKTWVDKVCIQNIGWLFYIPNSKSENISSSNHTSSSFFDKLEPLKH